MKNYPIKNLDFKSRFTKEILKFEIWETINNLYNSYIINKIYVYYKIQYNVIHILSLFNIEIFTNFKSTIRFKNYVYLNIYHNESINILIDLHYSKYKLY